MSRECSVFMISMLTGAIDNFLVPFIVERVNCLMCFKYVNSWVLYTYGNSKYLRPKM